jgi:N-acetylmuramoyl-L-alanine amidase
MIRKTFRERLVVGLIGLAACSTAAGAQLRSIELGATADSAQLTLELTESAPHKLFTLDHPDRAVIDLADTRLSSGLRAPEPAGIVSAIRLGVQPDGALRIVLELKSPLRPHAVWAAAGAGQRLVVDLGTPAGPAPSAPKPVRAAHAPGDGDRDVIIAVDAGHGGVDPGAIGHGGTREKDVTLAIARALAQRIDAEPGMRAVLTRDRDEFLDLRERMRRAHAAHADMFISVHADSIADRHVSGASVYVLSAHGASSEAARVLAERENAADLLGGALQDEGAPQRVILDAAQQEIIGISATAAERVVAALTNVGEIRRAQVQQAGFVVLKSPDIPSMLIETAYISNPAEERRLRDRSQQARLADAICSGVRSFFVQNPPDGTRFKQERRLANAGDAAPAAATP